MPGVFDSGELVKRTIKYLVEGVVVAFGAGSPYKVGCWGAALVHIMCRHSLDGLTMKEST